MTKYKHAAVISLRPSAVKLFRALEAAPTSHTSITHTSVTHTTVAHHQSHVDHRNYHLSHHHVNIVSIVNIIAVVISSATTVAMASPLSSLFQLAQSYHRHGRLMMLTSREAEVGAQILQQLDDYLHHLCTHCR